MISHARLARTDGHRHAPAERDKVISIGRNADRCCIDICESELHAYIDGFLDRSRSRTVEAYLAQHPHKDAMVKAYLAQMSALKEFFSVDQPMPDALGALCEQWKNLLSQKLPGRRASISPSSD